MHDVKGATRSERKTTRCFHNLRTIGNIIKDLRNSLSNKINVIYNGLWANIFASEGWNSVC